jgi:hypothetical protein
MCEFANVQMCELMCGCADVQMGGFWLLALGF